MSLKKARMASLLDKHDASETELLAEHVREEAEEKDEKVELIIKKKAKKD